MDNAHNYLSIHTRNIQNGVKIIDLCPAKAPSLSKQIFLAWKIEQKIVIDHSNG